MGTYYGICVWNGVYPWLHVKREMRLICDGEMERVVSEMAEELARRARNDAYEIVSSERLAEIGECVLRIVWLDPPTGIPVSVNAKYRKGIVQPALAKKQGKAWGSRFNEIAKGQNELLGKWREEDCEGLFREESERLNAMEED